MTIYTNFPKIDLPDRTWPSKVIKKSPIWCNVDLRDGNQALVCPMNPAKKLEWFKTITSIGFKEIEVSFPSASQQDFDFTRILIEKNHIPEDVTIQVLTQAREHLIYKTFEALAGVKRAIFHIYNSTSPAQRQIVFGKSKDEIIAIAVEGVKLVKKLAKRSGSKIILEYSPESFSQTELSFATEICNAVIDTWSPSHDEQMIINLPSTVEVAAPHVYADQIEYMCRQFNNHTNVIISVHTHNDRGCAVAAAELAQCAGATRVEGTIFGNGERTGNADLVTLALNCFSQGIDSKLDFSNINAISSKYSECTGMSVPVRQPYAGELVFTAFSGSHQDAISKALGSYTEDDDTWNIPYLPIDPSDIGRSYESVIRINSQSGKGGAAHILEYNYGFRLPRAMQIELGVALKNATALHDGELSANDVYTLFKRTFVDFNGPFKILEINHQSDICAHSGEIKKSISVIIDSPFGCIHIDSSEAMFAESIKQSMKQYGIEFEILSHDHTSQGSTHDNQITVYIQLVNQEGCTKFGAASDTDTITATLKAFLSAMNRICGDEILINEY